jgi:hypothetical protein
MFTHHCHLSFRDGRMRVGDEVINVCGKRLRGLDIDLAVSTLKQPTRDLDLVIARDVAVDDDADKDRATHYESSVGRAQQHSGAASKKSTAKSSNFELQNSKTSNFELQSSKTSNFELQNGKTSNFELPSSKTSNFDSDDRHTDGSLFSEQRIREEHRRIAQKLHNLGTPSSSSLCDYRIRNGPSAAPKPYVSRTYIGGGSGSSSLAMKIHRKNLQTRCPAFAVVGNADRKNVEIQIFDITN